MPRLPLEPGEVRTKRKPKENPDTGLYETFCRIGEPFGDPSTLPGKGRSPEAAMRDLNKAIKNWKPRARPGGTYGTDPTVFEICKAYLEGREADETDDRKTRPQSTRNLRKEIFRTHSNGARVDPNKVTIEGSDLGKMRARKVDAYHIRQHLKGLNRFTAKQSVHKTALNLAFAMVVDDELLGIKTNPVASVEGYRGEHAPRRSQQGKVANPYFSDEPQPFTREQLALYWELEAEFFDARKGCASKPRDPRFRDYTRLLYELAARPGEAAAVLVRDCNPGASKVTVTGTIIDTQLRVFQLRKIIDAYSLAPHEYVASKGWESRADNDEVDVAYRQPFTKTRFSMDKTIVVDHETTAMVRRRTIASEPGQTLLIPSASGKVYCPQANPHRVFRSIVRGSGLGWATLKTFRSTRATLVYEEHGLEIAQQILGHKPGTSVTVDKYVATGGVTVDLRSAQ